MSKEATAKALLNMITGGVDDVAKVLKPKHQFERIPGNWGDEGVTTFIGKDGKVYNAKLNLDHENWAGQHAIDLTHNGDEAASLTWNAVEDPDIGLLPGMVSMVDVSPEFRRQGLATALWEMANDAARQFKLAQPMHSPHLTGEGKAWVEALNMMGKQ